MGSLTKRQKNIVIGCLLGDGAMRCKTNALLEVNHSINQKNYVDWKFQELCNIIITPPKRRFGKNGRIAYRFTTKSIPALTEFYKQFYCNSKKIIPNNLKLNPMSLAVWFMDDGCKSYNAVYFNTQKFSMECQLTLIKMLKFQHGISATLNKDKIYWRIRVAVESVDKLKNLIKPFLLAHFQYKLPSRPRND